MVIQYFKYLKVLPVESMNEVRSGTFQRNFVGLLEVLKELETTI